MDSVTIDKWRFALDQDRVRADVDPKAHARISLRPFGFQPLADYRRVDRGTIQRSMCSAADRYAGGSELADVICGRSRENCGTHDCIEFPIRLAKAKGCSLTGRIACGSPDGELALNTTAFEFSHEISTGDAKRRVRFGEGDYGIELMPIVLHETGHWFGLDHESEDQRVTPASIMLQAFDPTEPWCVTEWNLVQLDNAVDKSWDFRLKGTHGLRLKSD
jgi:hypothetical protein